MLLKLSHFVYIYVYYLGYFCTVLVCVMHVVSCAVLLILHKTIEYSVIQWSCWCSTTKSKIQLGASQKPHSRM